MIFSRFLINFKKSLYFLGPANNRTPLLFVHLVLEGAQVHRAFQLVLHGHLREEHGQRQLVEQVVVPAQQLRLVVRRGVEGEEGRAPDTEDSRRKPARYSARGRRSDDNFFMLSLTSYRAFLRRFYDQFEKSLDQN